jgi:hypothetical protein
MIWFALLLHCFIIKNEKQSIKSYQRFVCVCACVWCVRVRMMWMCVRMFSGMCSPALSVSSEQSVWLLDLWHSSREQSWGTRCAPVSVQRPAFKTLPAASRYLRPGFESLSFAPLLFFIWGFYSNSGWKIFSCQAYFLVFPPFSSPSLIHSVSGPLSASLLLSLFPLSSHTCRLRLFHSTVFNRTEEADGFSRLSQQRCVAKSLFC